MSDIPRAVLSEHFEERMEGKRLLASVFTTYQFDPGFFEQHVLPIFLDIPLSHATPVKLVQLEDALRSLSGGVAVYYDNSGLVSGSDYGSAKLDIRRIPVRVGTGIFHAKNAFILLEEQEPDEGGNRTKTLLVGCFSANLTKSGWWQNVEACHVEEIKKDDNTRVRDDLVRFLERLRNRSASDIKHDALNEVLGFLRGTSQRSHKSTGGKLHPHFFGGTTSLPDFLEETAGDRIHGAYLEVISPYFDDAEDSEPLDELLDRFNPKEVRVFLPRDATGAGLCNSDLYESIRHRACWGKLPNDLLMLGKSADAGERFVHAKIYRFFTQNPKQEIIFVGSANLTRSAHQKGGNVEAGFLVELDPLRKPYFWLSQDERRPKQFIDRGETEGDSGITTGTPLQLRYWWDKKVGESFWEASSISPVLRLESRSLPIGEIGPLNAREWTPLPEEISRVLAGLLQETSWVYVYGHGDGCAPLLVQEEGMWSKPSLLLSLSVADILRYWSLLTPAQRAAFIEARAPQLALTAEGSDLVATFRPVTSNDTLFDRVAGYFHAFSSLERTVRVSLREGKEKEARYRLFGKKYDSLGNVLEQVTEGKGPYDDVDRYVLLLCTRQLCQELKKEFPEFWQTYSEDASVLEATLSRVSEVRERLSVVDAGMPMFLDWFERWFLRRATPVETEQ
jgi:hypothetical protein